MAGSQRSPTMVAVNSFFRFTRIVRKLCGVAICGFSVCLVGCTKSAKSVAERNTALFQSAPAQARAAWELAAAAAKTNGYFTALVALGEIQSDTTLSAEQQQAIKQLSTTLSDQMYDAVNKGDPSAKAALDALRKMRSR